MRNRDDWASEAIAKTDEFQRRVRDTNQDARDQMRRLERDLSAARVTPPEEYKPGSPPSRDQVLNSPLGGAAGPMAGAPPGGPGSIPYSPPPALPGSYPLPLWNEQGEYSTNEAGLAGIVPQHVPLTPGAPVSMVPLQPGHPLAPNGGALVLPNQGMGGGGVVQRPGGPSAAGGAGGGGRAGGAVGGVVPGARGAAAGPSGLIGGGAAGATGRPGGAAAGGMLGGALGGAGAGGAGGAAAGGGRADVKWSARRGVEPVIDGQPTGPQQKQDGTEDFDSWYSGLATPWKK